MKGPEPGRVAWIIQVDPMSSQGKRGGWRVAEDVTRKQSRGMQGVSEGVWVALRSREM